MLKKITLLTLTISMAFLMSGCGSKYARSTPEELGKSVFEAIKNKDRDGLRGLQPTKGDVLATIKASDLPEEEKKEALEEIEENWAEVEEEMAEDMTEFFREMEENKEDAAKMAEAEFDMVEVGKPKQREGLRMVDIKVHIKTGDQRIRIDIRKAAELKSGWVMSPDGFRMREEK